MDQHFEIAGSILKVSLSGCLGAACSEEFKDTMFECLRDFKEVLFNLEKLEYVDSSGLGALVSILQWMNSSGKVLKLCCLQPQPRIIFDITKVCRIFDIYDTEAQALAAFAVRF